MVNHHIQSMIWSYDHLIVTIVFPDVVSKESPSEAFTQGRKKNIQGMSSKLYNPIFPHNILNDIPSCPHPWPSHHVPLTESGHPAPHLESGAQRLGELGGQPFRCLGERPCLRPVRALRRSLPPTRNHGLVGGFYTYWRYFQGLC